MNKFNIIYKWMIRIISIILCLLSLIFIFIELRKVFAGEFLADENSIRSLLFYLVRAFSFILLLSTSILSFLFTLKKINKFIYHWSICLSVASLITPIYAFTYMEKIFGILILILLVFNLIFVLLIHLSNRKQEEVAK